MSIIACDIGGTAIKGTRFENTAKPIAQPIIEQLNDQSQGKDSTMRVLWEVIDALWQEDVERIGIVTAGAVDPLSGHIVGNTGTLRGWVGFSIKDAVQDRYGVPCFVDNDANGALLAALMPYEQDGITDAVMLTLGTGVGSGVLLGGRVLRGAHHQVELGHLTLYPGGKRCTCGARGCAEQYLSGRALTKRARDEVDPSIHHGRELFELVQAGDPKAMATLDRYLDDLIVFLHTIYRSFDPQLILIGGGVSDAGDVFLDRLRAKQETSDVPTMIRLATDGNFAGILGAYKIAKEG
jgi:glucokinase